MKSADKARQIDNEGCQKMRKNLEGAGIEGGDNYSTGDSDGVSGWVRNRTLWGKAKTGGRVYHKQLNITNRKISKGDE